MLRRLRIYFTGFAIGLVVVYFYFLRDDSRDLDIWTPEQRILESIRDDQAFQSSDAMMCYKRCLGLADGTLEKLWTEGEVESLNPGGNPYKYSIKLEAFDLSIEAIVEQEEDEHRLVSLTESGQPKDCNCAE